jgi:hypothetical protein
MNAPGVLFTLLTLLWAPAGSPWTHEAGSGYLELREVGDQTHDLLWKVPAKGNQRLGIDVRLPDHCRSSEPRTRFTGGAFVERWRASCTGGLISGGRAAAVHRCILRPRVGRNESAGQFTRCQRPRNQPDNLGHDCRAGIAERLFDRNLGELLGDGADLRISELTQLAAIELSRVLRPRR